MVCTTRSEPCISGSIDIRHPHAVNTISQVHSAPPTSHSRILTANPQVMLLGWAGRSFGAELGAPVTVMMMD